LKAKGGTLEEPGSKKGGKRVLFSLAKRAGIWGLKTGSFCIKLEERREALTSMNALL